MSLVRDLLFVLFLIVAAIVYFISEEEDKNTIAQATLGGITGGLIGYIIGKT